MNLQWYPGHMTKAKRMMQENIKLIDIVIELLDARIPASSKNPDIDELAKGKQRLVILNKADLASEEINNKWIEYYKEKGIRCVKLDSRNRGGVKSITNVILECCKEKIERDKKRGIVNRPIRAMVAGIPNVGKSTFINALTGRASAKTGNKPGVTKGKQWIRLNNNIELLDTPGILWPKFEDELTGEHIAYIGSMNDEILQSSEVAYAMLNTLKEVKPGVIAERYSVDETLDTLKVLEAIANERKCLKKGGEADLDRTSDIIIDDFRSGRLGRISIEAP
ncbi:MAG: ribosome biogenesis GTPase YlqF [Lachnospiraceae bacterium]|nr:ribosome biogenesis GTPase YlqF [Lachnospiraceae bacterium]